MGQANIQRHQGSPCFKKMGLPHFNTLVVRRKDTVGLLRMVDDLTGQLCHRLRNQPGIPGRKTGQEVQGFNINLIGRVDELGLACGSLLLQDRHFQLYPFGWIIDIDRSF